MKAIATRGRSYGKFFVGACSSREVRSFGFQVLEVVWGSHGVASGDMPKPRGGRGNGPDGAGPSDGGKGEGDSMKRSSGDGKAFRYRNDLLKRALAGLAGILLPPKQVKSPQTKGEHGVSAGFGNGVHVEAVIGVTTLKEDLSRRGAGYRTGVGG